MIKLIVDQNYHHAYLDVQTDEARLVIEITEVANKRWVKATSGRASAGGAWSWKEVEGLDQGEPWRNRPDLLRQQIEKTLKELGLRYREDLLRTFAVGVCNLFPANF